MGKYNELVKQMVESVFESICDMPRSLSVVAQGGEEYENCTMQDYADLRGPCAELFGAVIHDHVDVFKVDVAQFPVFEIRILNSNEKKKKYTHSCYPRNLRRWMNDTTPRKKKCRAELVTLICCWASGWKYELSREENHVECRKKLRMMCSEILKEELEDRDFENMKELTALLWKTSEVVYYKKETKS